ncbi:MAG TPA: TSUP family transporter [Gemmatimonadales bacterium]|nr:TSUP family transporter [Gemmatimonadales bacterium]
MLLSTGTIAALCGFAFLAAFTDAVVGGGGLIQLPALLVLVPDAPLPAIFGTHKLASTVGTMTAVHRYAGGLRIEWRLTIPAAVASFACSLLGAHAVSAIDPSVLRPAILVLLVGVAIFTWRARDFGTVHLPRLGPRPALAAGLVMGGALGFYDGFFGPGTGTFLIFGFVTLFGFDFLAATSAAKVVNLGSNFSAALYFAATDQVLYRLALPMAAASIVGATMGSRLALAKGVGLVRTFFLALVTVLVVKLALDTLRPH